MHAIDKQLVTVAGVPSGNVWGRGAATTNLVSYSLQVGCVLSPSVLGTLESEHLANQNHAEMHAQNGKFVNNMLQVSQPQHLLQAAI